MPRIKSAKKRQRQTAVRTARNKAQRSALRSAVKKARTSATAGETAEAFAAAQTLIDRAGRKNLIHRNVANRTKSRLAKLANKAAKTD
ncbi:MAG TPA: 30S ribosomal protein S20 [Gemmatimonadales bacterium]|nr:30S ribosomal protein S20 [Gemmatimonadales bacterium]